MALPLLKILHESRPQDPRRKREQSDSHDGLRYESSPQPTEKTLRPVTPGKTNVKAS